MMISLGALLGAIEFIPYFESHQALLLTTFLLIPGHLLFPEWFFQAVEKMKYITLLTFVAKGTFTALVFFFIKDVSDVILYPLFLSLGYVACGMCAFYIVLVKWKVDLLMPDVGDIARRIRWSTDVFINNIMPNLYNNFSLILLGFVGGSVANGIFDAGNKLVNIFYQLLMVVSRVFFPFLSRRKDKHGIYLRINLAIAVCSSLLLYALAPLAVGIFYTVEFAEAVIVIRVLAVSLVFIALSNIYGVNYLIINGHERQLRTITVACSLIGFVLAFPLVYHLEYLGAALVVAFTRFIMAVSITYKARRIINSSIAG